MVGYLPDLDTTQPPAFSSSRFIDPENPPPRATAAAEQRQKEKSSWVECSMMVGLVVFLGALIGGIIAAIVLGIPSIHSGFLNSPDPRYSVAIESFSGLLASNRTTDLKLLDHPEFNLTLRVASFSRRADACIDPGTYVEVAYRCVKLAATATAQQRLCPGPGKAADQQLIARGTQVHVPGAVLDSLTADMRQGAPAFQVTIRWSDGDYAECGDRHVGAADQDLGTSCGAWWDICPNNTGAKDGSN